jgi:hypothetical protein
MKAEFTPSELEAYLDEGLSPEEMAEVERALRREPSLLRKLASIHSRRDAGVHTLGEIWRRHRVSCPTREQLGSYLLGVLSAAQSDYIDFHLHKVGCRCCRANLDDMQRQHEETAEIAVNRRNRYFQSSAGYLRPDK